MNITAQVVENPEQIADGLRRGLNEAFSTAGFENDKIRHRLTSLLEEILDRAPSSVLLDCARSVNIVEAQIAKDELNELEDLSLVFEIGAEILKCRDSGVPPEIACLVMSIKHTPKVDHRYIATQIAMAYKRS